ncbi:MAG: galactokinase [Gemmatimonadales bacterium]|jgi:galactokinase
MTEPTVVANRIAALQHAFTTEYGAPGAHMARVPGRVNLIGDHTDYNGLPVLPMAIQRDVLLLCRVREDARICVANVDPQFDSRKFEVAAEIASSEPGDWCNYLKAAAQALAQQHPSLRGFDGMLSSTVPIAAGLSSSSAILMAAALMLVDLNHLAIAAHELMDMMAKAERYVGTQGGGMDQATCMGAEAGSASRIDFDPLRMTHVPVPHTWRFVVANSLVRADKSGSAMGEYNQRAGDCGKALAMVAASRGTREIKSYADLMSDTSLQEMLHTAKHVLNGTLFKRFRHVVTEGNRVTSATKAMRFDDLEQFGQIMSESHRSLRDDFEVSCTALDELTEMAVDAGASGARLTGAGFGGCAVALCSEDRVDSVVAALERDFYAKRELTGEIENVLFIAEPSSGAAVIEV